RLEWQPDIRLRLVNAPIQRRQMEARRQDASNNRGPSIQDQRMPNRILVFGKMPRCKTCTNHDDLARAGYLVLRQEDPAKMCLNAQEWEKICGRISPRQLLGPLKASEIGLK